MKALSSSPTSMIAAATPYVAGAYTLTGLVVGQNYQWTKGANDTNIVVNGSITLTASGVFTATATSVTLNGSGTTTITAVVALCQPVNLFAGTVTPTLPSRQVSIGQFPAANPNWSRIVQISDEYIFVKRATAVVALSIPDMINLALTQEQGLTWTPPIILTQPPSATCAATAAATGTLTSDNTNVSDAVAASGTLTSDNTNVANNETATIDAKVYTFKTALTPTEGEILIGGSADASLLNLIRAINHSGTPGTDYQCAAVHPTISAASSVTSHAFAITAKTAGTAGNSIVSTETSAHLSFGGATLSGGTAAETVTIDGKIYTFKTALSSVEGQVLIGGSADASLLNLIRAINHTGTPNTDYYCAAAHPTVTAAASVTAHAFAITAITSGTAGNTIATTETSSHLSWGAATLTSGTVSATTFTVSPGSEYILTYQWQYSVDGTSWSNCTGTVNGTAYTNGTTATLTCTPTTTGQTGYYHRCVVTDNAGSFGLTNGVKNTDGAAILTIP